MINDDTSINSHSGSGMCPVALLAAKSRTTADVSDLALRQLFNCSQQ